MTINRQPLNEALSGLKQNVADARETAEVIRHICAGHEYRYNVKTGDVRNNYGTIVATLRFEKFIPDTVKSIATLYRVDDKGQPVGLCFASLRNVKEAAALAEFAIGQCAAHGIE